MDQLVAVGLKAAEYFLTKFGESWDTPAMLKERMNDLKRKMEELNAQKKDMESKRSKELHPRKKLKAEVELWFKNVETVNSEIQALEQKIVACSNVALRGFFKGDVLKKIKEVEELQQLKFHDSLIVDNRGWIGQALVRTNLSGEAAKTCMEEIWGYLMGADVQRIGVWGMGGIGKTTIMRFIYNQLLKETERFDIVIWITVSKEMDVFKMQNRIARAMEKTLDEDEDKTIRAGEICEMLNCEGKYVLILDDLWEKLSLEDVGIPEPSNGSKLLVTTRLLDVCHSLDCRAVKVPSLSKVDGLKLFLEKVDQDVSSHPDLLPLVESVAEECAGLPLAIVTIASSMKGVHADYEWRNALHELQAHVKSVNKLDEKVFQQLKFSYDRLQDENVKHCFLCCALYPEDFEIYTEQLIEVWIAGGLVEVGSRQKELDRGHTILNKLKSNCLIEDSNRYGGVKLHDVVRDMAIRIASERPQFLVRSSLQLKEIMGAQHWKEDLEQASFMENRELQIPPQMPPPKCPKLTTLLLSRCNIKSIPECFFELMHGLKILDLSRNPIKSLPNSISNLEKLTTLLLSECNIQSIPECFFEQMHGLKILDLSCNRRIKSLPNSISNLEKLTTLLLSKCDIQSIPECFFEQMHGLKILDLSKNLIKSLPNSISNLETLTTLLLGDCSRLEKVPSVSKLEALMKLDIRKTKIKEIPDGMERLVNLKYLDLWGTSIEKIPDRILGKLTSLQYLSLNAATLVRGEEIGGLRKLERFTGGRFYDLKDLNSYVLQRCNARIKTCGDYRIYVGDDIMEGPYNCGSRSIEINGCDIISTDGDIKVPSDVDGLAIKKCSVDSCEEGAFLSQSTAVSVDIFSSLGVIHIYKCKNIKKLFSSNWVLNNFQNLDILTVSCCEDMEEIIASESEFEEEGRSALKYAFPKLWWLRLADLPELKSICGANGVIMVGDSIDEIEISNCPKLKRIPLNFPLQDDGQPSPLPPLRRIVAYPKVWWESVEWDHPNAKSTLEPCIDKSKWRLE